MISETAQLVRIAAGGDLDSFGILCQQHYVAMVGIAFSVLKDHQLAEDAVQEAFARALVSLPKIRDYERFGPWLGGICRNIATDMVKAGIRQAAIQRLADVPHNAKDVSNYDIVKNAVFALPTSQRELVVMRYYDGLSYEQISSALGISSATINGRLTRAKRKLAAYLKQKGLPEAIYAL